MAQDGTTCSPLLFSSFCVHGSNWSLSMAFFWCGNSLWDEVYDGDYHSFLLTFVFGECGTQQFENISAVYRWAKGSDIQKERRSKPDDLASITLLTDVGQREQRWLLNFLWKHP